MASQERKDQPKFNANKNKLHKSKTNTNTGTGPRKPVTKHD